MVRRRARLVIVPMFLAGVAAVASSQIAASAPTPKHTPDPIFAQVEAMALAGEWFDSVPTGREIDAVTLENHIHIREIGPRQVAVDTWNAEISRQQRLLKAQAAARADRSRRSTERGPTDGDILDRLAQCESGGNAGYVGRYLGAFQFLQSTWNSVHSHDDDVELYGHAGVNGTPQQHSYAEQKAAASRLIARSGWGQFPGCARKLGMR